MPAISRHDTTDSLHETLVLYPSRVCHRWPLGVSLEAHLKGHGEVWASVHSFRDLCVRVVSRGENFLLGELPTGNGRRARMMFGRCDGKLCVQRIPRTAAQALRCYRSSAAPHLKLR